MQVDSGETVPSERRRTPLNGSTIVALPCVPQTIRGFTANLLILDEAAFIPDVVHAASGPMLATTDGHLALMSHTGFLENYDAGARSELDADDCFRKRRFGFSRKFLDEKLRELGEERYRREYECEFGDVDNEVFLRKVAERALKDDVPPRFKR